MASPPIKSPCYYGINIPRESELIAANKTIEEIRKDFAADSVEYLSVDGLKEAVRGEQTTTHCTGCLTGEYPLPPDTIDIEDIATKITH